VEQIDIRISIAIMKEKKETSRKAEEYRLKNSTQIEEKEHHQKCKQELLNDYLETA
jgi:hypothetical protein